MLVFGQSPLREVPFPDSLIISAAPDVTRAPGENARAFRNPVRFRIKAERPAVKKQGSGGILVV